MVQYGARVLVCSVNSCQVAHVTARTGRAHPWPLWHVTFLPWSAKKPPLKTIPTQGGIKHEKMLPEHRLLRWVSKHPEANRNHSFERDIPKLFLLMTPSWSHHWPASSMRANSSMGFDTCAADWLMALFPQKGLISFFFGGLAVQMFPVFLLPTFFSAP